MKKNKNSPLKKDSQNNEERQLNNSKGCNELRLKNSDKLTNKNKESNKNKTSPQPTITQNLLSNFSQIPTLTTTEHVSTTLKLCPKSKTSRKVRLKKGKFMMTK
jgi:hypothetical protein